MPVCKKSIAAVSPVTCKELLILFPPSSDSYRIEKRKKKTISNDVRCTCSLYLRPGCNLAGPSGVRYLSLSGLTALANAYRYHPQSSTSEAQIVDYQVPGSQLLI